MTFSDKLWKIRDEMDISQERLAEELNVSRQAVAKWESGVAMPDIDHLVGLSHFFQVSLDYLIKDTAYRDAILTSNNDSSEIIDFIVRAKKNTYANFGAGKVAPSRVGSTDLAYEAGEFKYLDTYVGDSYFSGSEVVYRKELPIWSMNYNGRLFTGQLGNFLTKVLTQVSEKMPYRGPSFYQDGKYTYVNSVSGEFNWFQGAEKIYYEGELIYELVYHGGWVRWLR